MSDKKNSNKRSIILFGGIILFALVVKLYSYHWPSIEVKINNNDLKVLVAKESTRLYKGLGGRENLDKYDGMLFVFPSEDQHSIVMRDMKFPIDILWIRDGKVIDIAPNVPIEPNRAETDLIVYFARQDSDFVLEMPAGQVLARNIKIGDSFAVGNWQKHRSVL